jgi:hypothetical protein
MESFTLIMAMRRRACSLFALPQSDPVALRRFVRRQDRHRGSDHIQCRLTLILPQDKGLNTHDLAVSCKDEDCRLTCLFVRWPRNGPGRYTPVSGSRSASLPVRRQTLTLAGDGWLFVGIVVRPAVTADVPAWCHGGSRASLGFQTRESGEVPPGRSSIGADYIRGRSGGNSPVRVRRRARAV